MQCYAIVVPVVYRRGPIVTLGEEFVLKSTCTKYLPEHYSPVRQFPLEGLNQKLFKNIINKVSLVFRQYGHNFISLIE
jgi:hypothetical protein